MGLALEQARMGLFLTSPNPRVGCVLVSESGEILGEGHTQQAGGPHAEIMALRDAELKGHLTTGATAYVTLEPCCHYGRTGPCCDALISAGIKKVVASIADPNPLVSGQGFERLRAAGVEVIIGPGAAASRELNIGFFSRMIRKKPWVRMKIAASLDGRTALENGSSQWITSDASRTDGHIWRARACAVLTGIGTVLHDRPRLDVRLTKTPRQPHLAVVDGRLETPTDSPVFISGRTLFIYAATQNDERRRALEAHGATVIIPPNDSIDRSTRVDLPTMLCDLASKGINELHVEAGQRLNGSLVQEGLVDEFVVYLAPKLIGLGQDMVRFGPLSQLSQAVGLEFISTTMLGTDLQVIARVKSHNRF